MAAAIPTTRSPATSARTAGACAESGKTPELASSESTALEPASTPAFLASIGANWSTFLCRHVLAHGQETTTSNHVASRGNLSTIKESTVEGSVGEA